MPYEVSLLQVLESNDNELFERLNPIEKVARPLLSYTQGKFPFYTPHDFYHSETVLENLNWLIPDSIKDTFNNYEIFFLVISAWLHDWGMIGKENENSEEIRENHHIRTEDYLEKLYKDVKLSQHEAIIIGRICKGHRKINLHSQEYDDKIIGSGIRIRMRFLAALLRLADETDITHSRTPEIIYHTLNPSGKSEEEFGKHLNISGIGQLDEPHKIYITAIARDPKGAQTLREVESKIQAELDAVKSILSQNGILLDIVELRMETRGFIDKPIAFEVNKNKIVDLLIGKHLYGKVDVAIRELVQNSIDACNIKKLQLTEYTPLIMLDKKNANTLVISDNGTGMGFIEAKKFLSNVGSSYYQSDDFQMSYKENSYNPISHFGIGLLSSFLIADSLMIETKREGQEACRFTISSLSENWKYEKGLLKDSGTVITLHLNDEGKKILISESLNRYFISSNIPIEYQDIDNENKIFDSVWTTEILAERFINNEKLNRYQINKIAELNTKDYDAFLVKISDGYNGEMILFNQGVYVNNFEIECLGREYCVFVNLKSKLIDMHISREDVIINEKWSDFVYSLSQDILESILDGIPNRDLAIFSNIISSLISNWNLLDEQENINFLKEYPFLYCILEKAPFPLIHDCELKWATFNDILDNEKVYFYECNSKSYSDEISLFCKVFDKSKAFFNPYRMPDVYTSIDNDEYINLIEYICNAKGVQLDKINLRTLLLEIAKPSQIDYSNILPSNMKFASFDEYKPLIVIQEYPKIATKKLSLALIYADRLLLQELIEQDTLKEYEKSYFSIDELKIINEAVVLIDSTDPFINSILNKYNDLKETDYIILKRYFKYLTFLPFVMKKREVRLIFIELLGNIEKAIAESLCLEKPAFVFSRMKPNSNLFSKYFEMNRMDYIIEVL